MRAAIFREPFVIEMDDRPDPVIVDSTDAIVRVTATCICGSDLWYYKGVTPREHGQTIGHEFIGVVEAVGSDVTAIKVGDFVVAPFKYNDGTCPACRAGVQASCFHGAPWGAPGADGGQGEALRVPFADSTLVVVPGGRPANELLPSLLALTDVMSTGHHAAVSAEVAEGSTVAVIGDGAVGLSAILAAKRLGAERIIALSRHEPRQKIARQFGATDIWPERGDEVAERMAEETSGAGVDAVLECVGTNESRDTSLRIVAAGGAIGFVGVPQGSSIPMGELFSRNIRVAGGVASARKYIPELLPDVLDGTINPGAVFDSQVDLEDIPQGYEAMNNREAIKVMSVLD